MLIFISQEELLESVRHINNTYLGPILIVFLLGAGLYYTIRLHFIQRHVFRAFRLTFKGAFKRCKATKAEGMSQFQALSTAVAAQLGTGNIIGVATAIAAGGPGAVFWLWVSALVGMATNYAEAVLSQLYKTSIDGHVVGGPAYYILKGLKSKFLATFFAIVAVIVLGFMGTIVQSNSICLTLTNVLPIKPIYIGIVVAIIVGFILIGGITRIAAFAEKVVPIMACIYITGGLIVIGMNYEHVVPAIESIFVGAFSPQSLGGGVLGITIMKAMRYGISRGLFSNEAGIGTTPHAHAVAKVKHPYEQGMMALVGVGTNFIVCTISALIVLVTGSHLTNSGADAAQASFGTAFGEGGLIFVAVTLFFFSLTTIVGWYFFAAQNLRYLIGEKCITPFRMMVVAVVVVGSILQVELVWELTDAFNVFLVVPNIIALLLLSPKVIEQTRKLAKAIKDKQM